jgi:hypothetical protein
VREERSNHISERNGVDQTTSLFLEANTGADTNNRRKNLNTGYAEL